MSTEEHLLSIIDAHDSVYLPVVRVLFREYAKAIAVDLCFQNFEQELAELPGRYAPPAGRLFLAVAGNQMLGCAALRPLAEGICEMKRLYVRPAARRHGAGRALAQAVIDAARDIGYQRMRLDTLATMTEAIVLYQSLGFHAIPPYYQNPCFGAVFMELGLTG